jgi:hypothetical protein
MAFPKNTTVNLLTHKSQLNYVLCGPSSYYKGSPLYSGRAPKSTWARPPTDQNTGIIVPITFYEHSSGRRGSYIFIKEFKVLNCDVVDEFYYSNIGKELALFPYPGAIKPHKNY